jgi:ATP-dependent helicase/nuclease subunit A
MSTLSPPTLDLDVLAAATDAQRQGSEPTASAWVSASAGSGKTKVLRDRVLRLLLAGIEPSRILCLTFTKAAAAEMSNRIAETLASWSSIAEKSLIDDLHKLGATGETKSLVSMARRLFARVLDTPGGMRIETIHAFCQSLLRRFPLEANVAPHFTLIEERDSATLMREARDDMLNAARAEPEGELRAALDVAVARMNEGRLNDLLGELLNRRARFQRLIERSADLHAIRRALRNQLGVGMDETREATVAGAVTDVACDVRTLRRIAEALNRGSEPNQAVAGRLTAWIQCDVAERAARFDDYCSIFLIQSGEPRKKVATKGALAHWADVNEAITAEAVRLMTIGRHLRAIDVATATEALLRLGRDVLVRYEDRKDAAAQLDYEDLILKSVDLLRRPGIAPWVLYKLDGGLDHVLIDEAQDTNPEQWQVISALTAEFFAGQGIADYPRTLFAVGDRKQSIYSFQGAAPEEFGRHQVIYDELTQGRLRLVQLNVSFRSTAAVLNLVDRVFNGGARAGVADDGDIAHRVSRTGEFGEIVVWPVACPVDDDEPGPWALPQVRTLTASPDARLAEAIADEIGDLLRQGTTGRIGRARKLNAGDIMILVRNRTHFVELMVRALKRRSIAVAGIDRMRLLEQIAVQDIMAFADFLLLPEDDLNLAALLKSPLVGLNEDELFELCVDRDGLSLWSRIAAEVHRIPAARRAHDVLQPYLDSVGFTTPFDLLALLIEGEGGRQRLYQRLGQECGEAIDEFLNLALKFEANHAPDLQAMLRWMREGELTVTRDLEEGGGRVRIITVHGAKGLEAPVVFLADQRRRDKPPSGLFWLRVGDVDMPIWSPNKAADDPVAEAARAAAMDRQRAEENRLLYVAMTRAEERLYVCGWKSKQPINTPNWHDHVQAALREMPGVATLPRPAHLGGPAEGWSGDALRLSIGAPAVPVASAAVRAEVDLPPPAWLREPAPALPDPPRPLTPSQPSEPEPAALSPLGEDEGWRYQRGRVVHHLLEMLPQVAPKQRMKAALDYLARPSTDVAPAQREALAREVVAVIDRPDFAAIFGPDSRAEVPVVATLRSEDGRAQVLSGQIDRLVVLPDEVWVVDFKSNRPAPMLATHVSQQYLRQLAAYRRALTTLYGTREIRCFLLWTDGPRLMEIDKVMLNAHGSNPSP